LHEGGALRASEYNRGTGCGKTARPGLCRGHRVTGVPTARDALGLPTQFPLQRVRIHPWTTRAIPGTALALPDELPASGAQARPALAIQCVGDDAPISESKGRASCCSKQHEASVVRPIRRQAVDLPGPAIIPTPRYRAPHDADTTHPGGIAHGDTELCPWHRLMVPVVLLHEGISLFQAYGGKL
jgi:hypothetical protein